MCDFIIIALRAVACSSACVRNVFVECLSVRVRVRNVYVECLSVRVRRVW